MARKLVIESKNVNPKHQTIESMRKLYKETPPNIGEMAPQEVKFVEVDVKELMDETLPQYQRGFELGRTKILIRSMTKFGYMPASIIVIVKKLDGSVYLHDGRHRTVASYVIGIKKIPAVIVTFKNIADEINHFNAINKARAGTKIEQTIFNEFQANDPLAMLIYELGYMDPHSKWSDKIALIGAEKLKDKMSVANFCKIINWVGLQLRRRREGESNIRALSKLKKTSYPEILGRVNKFHDWYYKFATPIKVVNDVFHQDRVLISLLEFFYCAHQQNSTAALLQPDKILNTAVNTFRNYNFQELSRFDSATAPDQLFDHFNKKRKTYKVKRVKRV